MGRFTFEQRWEILRIYFQSKCCVAETVQNLRRIVGRNEAPTVAGVRKFIKKVQKTGMLVDNKSYPCARPVCTDERIAAVVQSMRETPRTSTRHRAQQLDISRISLTRILDREREQQDEDNIENKEHPTTKVRQKKQKHQKSLNSQKSQAIGKKQKRTESVAKYEICNLAAEIGNNVDK